MAESEKLSPTLVNMLQELRRVVEVEVKADVARRMADKNVAATDIATYLGVSRQTVYRYLNRENGAPVFGEIPFETCGQAWGIGQRQPTVSMPRLARTVQADPDDVQDAMDAMDTETDSGFKLKPSNL